MFRPVIASHRWIAMTLLCASCASGSDAGAGDAHRHPVRGDDVAAEVGLDVTLRPAASDTDRWTSSARSRDGRFRAMVRADRRGQDVLMVRDERSGEILVVSGLPFARPIDDVAWDGADRLVFDQWPQPHHGVHYEMDVRIRRLSAAYPVPDSSYLATQHGRPVPR
jgi:hypothetical protein